MYQLREIDKKDLQIINQWRNDFELVSMLGAPFRYININVDINWFEHYMLNRSETVRCAIVKNCDDKILGLVSLTSVDYMNQSAELHIMIGDKENQGQGIGTFAVSKMLFHAFNNMNLQRIELTVLDSNKIAQHLYKKIGFVLEGTKRKAKFKNGEFVNILLYSVLKEDYFKNEI